MSASSSAAAPSQFSAQVAEAFAPDGALRREHPTLGQRAAQQQLAAAVALAIEARGALVAEAGTGIGKTFAYLVPLLLSGRRGLVSTATKSLQDQLFLRDLPRLRDALGVRLKLALLKGRASYLCLHRMANAAQDADATDRWTLRTLAKVQSWAQATRTGDLAEMPGLDDRSAVIPLVTSTRENCLGSECPRFTDCHVMRARREALSADLVVVNHHLFFADLVLRDSGMAELLPSVDVVVFDEAHQLVEAGVQFLGQVLSSGQVLDFAHDLLAQGLRHARGLRPWHELAAALETAARELRLHSAGALRDLRGAVKLRWEERAAAPPWREALQRLQQACAGAADAIGEVREIDAELERLEQRAARLGELAARFAVAAAPDHVRWIELTAQQARLVESPLDIRDMLSEQRRRAAKTWVFTSATLGDDAALSWFTRNTGLEDATTLRLGSPFEYRRQARAWVPLPFLRPNDAGHAQAVGRLAASCARVLGGRCFVLTTTLRVLPLIAEALSEALAGWDETMQVLVQGSQPRRALLERFGDGRRCVLVGSQSFWEGIDVPGDALQCVLIDKLPFPPPNDPLVQARARQIEARGGNAFNDYFVAEAAVSLKQGAGRLIRSETDRGLLVLCDPRARQMPYGRRLLAALPPMPLLDDECEAMHWLAELAAAH